MKSRFLLVIGVIVVLLASAVPAVVTGQSVAPAEPEAATLQITANAPVFSWPQDNAQQLSVLPAGSSVPTNGRLVDSMWWQIPFPGGPNGNAWVQAANVKPNAAAQDVQTYELKSSAQPTPSPAPGDSAMVTLTAEATIMAWPDDNAQPLGKLPAGTSLPTNGRLGDAQWWQIPYPGGPNGNGWIPAYDVKPNAAAANVPVYEVIVPTPEAPPTPAIPTPASCQFNSAFVTDVTIPDNTTIQPGQSFDKVWRFKNTGTCAWTASTMLNFIGGEQMSAQASVTVPATVPGATADIGVTMIGPQTPGQHRNVWQLENQGQFFGSRVTAVIVVPGEEPPAPPQPTGQPSPGQPSISFWADTDRVAQGQCTSLHWNVDNAQAVYLKYQDKTNGVGGHDSRQVCPSNDGKRYTLDVVGYDGQHYTRETQINISGPEVSINFWSDNGKVTIGTCTVVHWNVANAQRVQFNDSNGWADVSPNDSRQVCPAYPTNYGLKVTDLSGKKHERSLTIKTKTPPLLPTPEPEPGPMPGPVPEPDDDGGLLQ